MARDSSDQKMKSGKKDSSLVFTLGPQASRLHAELTRSPMAQLPGKMVLHP